jgi:hypothetical protein
MQGELKGHLTTWDGSVNRHHAVARAETTGSRPVAGSSTRSACHARLARIQQSSSSTANGQAHDVKNVLRHNDGPLSPDGQESDLDDLSRSPGGRESSSPKLSKQGALMNVVKSRTILRNDDGGAWSRRWCGSRRSRSGGTSRRARNAKPRRATPPSTKRSLHPASVGDGSMWRTHHPGRVDRSGSATERACRSSWTS